MASDAVRAVAADVVALSSGDASPEAQQRARAALRRIAARLGVDAGLPAAAAATATTTTAVADSNSAGTTNASDAEEAKIARRRALFASLSAKPQQQQQQTAQAASSSASAAASTSVVAVAAAAPDAETTPSEGSELAATAQSAAAVLAVLDSLPQATRQQLIGTLLMCFPPPPRNAASPIRFQQTETCRRAAVRLVRSSVLLLLRDESLLSRTLLTVALSVGAVEAQLHQAPITLGANTHNHERHGAGEGGTAVSQQHFGPPAQEDEDKPDVMAAAAAAAADKAYAKQEQPMRTEYLSLVRTLLLFDFNSACAMHLGLLATILYVSLCTVSEDAAFLHLCDALTRLASAYPQPMRQFSRILLVPLIQRGLAHKKASVKIEAIRALALLVPCGAGEIIRDLAAFREHNVIDIKAAFAPELGRRINYMGLLVADSNVRVREAFATMMHDWILSMHERADFETLIWPYVLSGLSDAAPSIRAIALDALVQAGTAYESDELQYRVKDVDLFRAQRAAEEQARAHLHAESILLFEPFTERPPWGARQIGRTQLDRLQHAIVTEVSDWKQGVASQSWTLLRVFLQLVEEHATKHVSDVIAALVGVLEHAPSVNAPSVNDESLSPLARERLQGEQQTVWDCAALCGRYTDPVRLVAVLTAQVASASATGRSRRLVAALRLIAHVLPFVASQHPSREEALDTLVQKVLRTDDADAGAQPDYLAHERVVFEAYVAVVARLLRLPRLSHTWTDKHAGTLFRVLLEIAAWSRMHFAADANNVAAATAVSDGSVAAVSAPAAASSSAASSATPAASAASVAAGAGASELEVEEERSVDVETDPRLRLARRIDLCFRWLLRQYGEDEGPDLVLLLQLRLTAWEDVLLAPDASTQWSERSLYFCMLLEVLERVASSSDDDSVSNCFVALPETALAALEADDAAPLTADRLKAFTSPAVRLSLLMQLALLRVLSRPATPAQLGLQAALLPPLAECLKASRHHFAPTFIRCVAGALVHGVPVHAAHFHALHASHASAAAILAPLRPPSLPPKEIEALQTTLRTFPAQSALFTRYVAGARHVADALCSRIEQMGTTQGGRWVPTEEQQRLLEQPLPVVAPLKEFAPSAATSQASPCSLAAWLAF
jgi:hypothetical protein